MDYLYENLGDERFQEFCNCLVAKEFPDFQSFPVGQRDGGRDSLAYNMQSTKKDYIVFQVKFVRNPQKINDIHKWLTEIIDEEAPKIDKLIPRGAKKFYLLTNVNGTAFPDYGSIDKVNKILEEKIKIPSICWWRDDLSRRFEKDPLFKWSYPEILHGQDILNSILFNNINENKERRENVIRAYLADQYEIDSEVKFKQIELQNKLFDLFTDVPIRIKKINKKNNKIRQIFDFIHYKAREASYNGDLAYNEEDDIIGAVFFLLHPLIQNELKRILLEGAPGQGKSTISQYICQTHRAKLLNKEDDLGLLPNHFRNIPVRLPFKIDLRDIASWVEKENPYQSRLNEEYFTKIWKQSLESFLIGHIVYHSQIDKFDTSDFIAISKHSSILFVFDGFDEIANLKVRKDVIDFINKGINRISENSKSIQVLITSRPAAFSDTVSFSIDQYPHFELGDITPTTTKEYVAKWIKASRLDSREAAQIRTLVEEKLEMPHLRDLTKNPMQLAIFISLLRTRGESLPNKRTALYDSYIELFFNRESEKNSLVRDHRDLIIDIHQYLAWVLHSEAELFKNSGRIQIEDLKRRLKEYLSKEGHKTDIADKLFNVLKERVCALVSRIQGTFEFEVQPLREYFCAKYLYNTSPYSPVGNEKKGSKPERFDAISKNFYWNNVVRFFAGCFDKGELPMLILKLKELHNDELLKYTNYPRLVTSQILSDWVFTQYPILLKDVIKIIVDGINIGGILNQAKGTSYNDEPILLPYECGRAEVVSECFEQLKKFPHEDYALELIGIIRNNPYNTLEYWTNYAEQLEGGKLTTWFSYAYFLQIIHTIEENLLIKLVQKGDSKQISSKLQTLINGNQVEIIDKNEKLKTKAFNDVLSGSIFVFYRKSTNSSLQFLSSVIHPTIITRIFDDSEPNITFINFVSQRFRYFSSRGESNIITDFKIVDAIDNLIKDFSDSVTPALNTDLSEWRKSLEPWDTLVEKCREYFKDEWGIHLLSVIAAGIKSKKEKHEEFDDLHNNSVSLCKRVRCARMKSGNIKYWESQLKDPNDLVFVLLVFFTWSTPKTINQLLNKIDVIIKNLEEEEYLKLVNSLKKVSTISKFSSLQQKSIVKELDSNNISDELLFIISLRFNEGSQGKFIYERIGNIDKKLEMTNGIRVRYLTKEYLKNSSNSTLLDKAKTLYSTIINPAIKYENIFLKYVTIAA